MSNDYAEHLVLWYLLMHDNTQADHDKWQPRRLERKQSEKAEHHIRIPSAPDVHQRTTKRCA